MLRNASFTSNDYFIFYLHFTRTFVNNIIVKLTFSRRIHMPQKQPNKNNTQTNVAGTDPQKVKQEIQKDISQGQGDITSREAGAMRD